METQTETGPKRLVGNQVSGFPTLYGCEQQGEGEAYTLGLRLSTRHERPALNSRGKMRMERKVVYHPPGEVLCKWDWGEKERLKSFIK